MSGVNCAHYRDGGNWWNSCGDNNVNGQYRGNLDIGEKYMSWYLFDDNLMALKTMTLIFRQAV